MSLSLSLFAAAMVGIARADEEQKQQPTAGACVIGIGGPCNNNEKSNIGTGTGGDSHQHQHHSNQATHQHDIAIATTSLSNQANATLHMAFEKCYKIIAPAYLRDALTIPATALLEKYTIGNATGITNADNNMIERVSACMKGEPYTPFKDLNK